MLAGREHSRTELQRKLAARGHTTSAVEQVLDDLQGRGLLDDRRFAEQYTQMRVRKGYGPLRIRAELRERGIDAGIVGVLLDTGSYDWRELLQEVRLKRFGPQKPAVRAEQARQARFLSQRGFPESLVRAALLGD